MIATFNFCEKYFTQTRDYGMVTERPAEVAEIRDCFEADWDRQHVSSRARQRIAVEQPQFAQHV